MDIPKISLSSITSIEQEPVDDVVPEKPVEPDNLKVTRGKIPYKLLISSVILLGIGISIYLVFTRFIVWNDESEIEAKEVIIAITPPPSSPQVTGSENEMSSSVSVKGKITVIFTKELGEPFLNGSVRLKTSGGKLVREILTEKSGTVAFDELPAGTYTVEGSKKGESRMTTKNVTLGAGELVDVAISLFLDTNVSITVNVKNSSGDPFANQAFTLRKLRSEEEGPLDYPVTTNGNGIFTQSNISPDQNWILMIGEQEVAHFTVVPTGKDQTIHVQTSGN